MNKDMQEQKSRAEIVAAEMERRKARPVANDRLRLRDNATDEERRAYFRRMEGLVTPMARQEPVPAIVDRGTVSSAESTLTVGLHVPLVAFGSAYLHAHNPDTWDVQIYKSAQLDGNFSGFSLPEVGWRVRDYIEGGEALEFDNTDGAPRIDIQHALDSRSYYLQARAVIYNQQGSSVAQFLGGKGAIIDAVTWAGPINKFIPGEPALQVAIADHHVTVDDRDITLKHDVSAIYNTVGDTDPDLFGPYHYNLFDLHFTTTDGGPWRLIVSRLY